MGDGLLDEMRQDFLNKVCPNRVSERMLLVPIAGSSLP